MISLLHHLWIPSGPWEEALLVHPAKSPYQRDISRPMQDHYAQSLEEAFMKVSKEVATWHNICQQLFYSSFP
jgi:hypothetical protein